MEELVQIFVPLGICVVLPVLIVWVIFKQRSNADNRRAEVLLKAIESNRNVNVEDLAKILAKPKPTKAEQQSRRLFRACIWIIIGILFIGVSIVAMAQGASVAEDDSASLPLLIGSICLAPGIGYLAIYRINRKQQSGTDSETDNSAVEE